MTNFPDTITTARFARKNVGSSHSYTLDGHRIPGVTSIIGKVLDKPALVAWAARETAAFADEHWERLSRMRSADRLKELEQARFRTNKAAVVRGNRLHEFGQKVAAEGAAAVPLEYREAAEAYARFLDRWQLEPLCLETPVCNTEYRYGGTLDAIMRTPKLGTILMDVKTGSGVYSETALQLAAYRYADVRLTEIPQRGPRGGVLPSTWQEEPMVDVDACYVAHVQANDVELVPLKAGSDEYETFLYLLEVFESWVKRTSWNFRDDPSYDPPVGKPIWPEHVEEKAPF